jgi:hypothetical protein
VNKIHSRLADRMVVLASLQWGANGLVSARYGELQLIEKK